MWVNHYGLNKMWERNWVSISILVVVVLCLICVVCMVGGGGGISIMLCLILNKIGDRNLKEPMQENKIAG